MANTLSIDIPAEVSSTILQKALDVSGLTALIPNVEYVSDEKDRIFYNIGLSDARFHNPVSENKVVDSDGLTTVEVNLYDLYKIVKVQEFTQKAIPNVIQQLKTSLGQKLGETLQKAVFGTDAVPTSPFAGFGTAEAIDITSPDALAGVFNSVPSASGWIFNKRASGDLRTALSAGTTSNPLGIALPDGTLAFAGVPAYFSNLGVDSTVIAGVVGDWSQAVLAIDPTITLQAVDGSTDAGLQIEDAAQFKAKIRVGFAVADPASFKLFKNLTAPAGV